MPTTETDYPQTKVLPLYQRGDWAILEIRGERDVPNYNPREVGRGMGEQKYRREVLGDWDASTGKLVYPEFGPAHVAIEPLEFDPDKPLACGWDFGGSAISGTPAFVPTQLQASGQWFVYPCVCPPEDITVGIYEFGEIVREYLENAFARPAGLHYSQLKVRHYGDPAGANRPPKTLAAAQNRIVEMRSCYEILRNGMQVVVDYDKRGEPVYEDLPGLGITVERAEVSLLKRMETLRARLSTLTHGLAALVCEQGTGEAPCLYWQPNLIVEGFQGGYCYPERLDGRFELDPGKSWWSHGMNALEYVASRLFTARPEVDEEYRPGPEPWKSRTSGRRVRGLV